MFRCKCECNSIKDVQLANLRSGNTISCGCFSKEVTSKRCKSHGKSKELLYGVYQQMISRCYNPKHISYRNYGARGIKVCKAWRNKTTGLDAFYSWALANGYKQGLELDREDNDENYKPDNCRFITCSSNNRNKRNNVVVNSTLAVEYFEKYNKNIVHKRTFYRRLEKGWSLKAAIGTPSQRGTSLTTRN